MALVDPDCFKGLSREDQLQQIFEALSDIVAGGGGGGGAPTDATYITQTPNATLTNEQALSALGTGPLFNTTGTGVLSIAATTGVGTTLALAQFPSITSASLTTPTIGTPTFSGTATWPDNVRQTFNPGANNAGLNVGAQAGDPSAPVNGDLWYDSTANTLDARVNGVTISLDQSLRTSDNVSFGSLIISGTSLLDGDVSITGSATITAGTSAVQGKPVLVLYQQQTPVGVSAAGGEQNLWNQSVAANVQSVNGDRIRVSGTVVVDGNSSSATLRIRYGATLVLELEFTVASVIDFSAVITRTGAAAESYGARSQSTVAPATGALITAGTAAEALNGAVALRITGEETDNVADAIILQSAVIEFLPAP